MMEKYENITDITLSLKFHSSNNIAVTNGKVRMLLILYCPLEFNFDNNPVITMYSQKYTANIKTLTAVSTTRNLA